MEIRRLTVDISSGKNDYKTADESFTSTQPAKHKGIDISKLTTAQVDI